MHSQRTHDSGPSPEAAGAQLLTFRLGEEDYGIDVLKVQEIRGFSAITSLPNVSPEVRGVMNLRGTVIPVLDLRAMFGLPARAYDRYTVIIVLRVDERTVGVIVDTVTAVITVPADQLSPPPDLATRAGARLVKGLARVKDSLVLRLDIDELVAPARGDGGSTVANALA